MLTTLARTGTPLLRYRTRDLTRILPGPCPCGRTHRRIDRIRGRSDDMMIINGVNIFPMQIEQTLMRIPGIGTNYLIEIHEENFMDKLHVSVELAADAFQGTLSQLEGLQGRVLAALKEETGVTPVVKLLEAGQPPRGRGQGGACGRPAQSSRERGAEMAWHLSVFVVNEPGKLEKITRVLSEAGLNIRAVSMASTGEFGVVRVLVNDPDRGLEALKENRFTVTKRRILVAQIDDAPGAMHELLVDALRGARQRRGLLRLRDRGGEEGGDRLRGGEVPGGGEGARRHGHPPRLRRGDLPAVGRSAMIWNTGFRNPGPRRAWRATRASGWAGSSTCCTGAFPSIDERWTRPA